MKKSVWIGVIVGVVIVISIVFIILNQREIPPTLNEDPLENYPEVSDNYPFYTIKEINEMNEPGIYNTEGYVVYISYCPPCPKGYECSICESPNIVISDKNDFSDEGVYLVDSDAGERKFRKAYDMENYQPIGLRDTELIVNFGWRSTTWDYLFELDSKYKFTLEIMPYENYPWFEFENSSKIKIIAGKPLGIEKID